MQVSSALKYLNEIKPPVIHYDLKPGKLKCDLGYDIIKPTILPPANLFCAYKHSWMFLKHFRQHFADGRECERRYQDYRLWFVQNYGQRQLQSRTWYGFNFAGCWNLLVPSTRVLCRRENTTKNFLQGGRVVDRCHILSVSLWQKGMNT